MTRLIRSVAGLAAVALSGLALAACSGSSSSPATSGTALTSQSPTVTATPTVTKTVTATPTKTASPTSTVIDGGQAACTKAVLTEAVNADLQNDGQMVVRIDSYRCANGWSYAIVTSANAGGSPKKNVHVFQAEGQFWIPVPLTKACGKTKSEAQIPSTLYPAACQAAT